MALEEQIDGIASLLEILQDDDFSNLYRTEAPAQPWNNLTSDEIKNYVEDVFNLLSEAVDNGAISTIPFNLLTGINNHLNKFNQQFQGVKALDPAQVSNQHHNPLNQIQAVDGQLRASGLYSILKLGPDIDQKKKLIESQVQASTKAAAELDKLTGQVRALLDPAVAGALSNAFDVRRKSVSKQKWFWFLMLIIAGAGSIWLSLDVTDFITNIFKTAEETKTNVGFVWFLRLLLLIPAYFFIAFSVSQFLRERHYEESYAHKSSIAQTLPSYSELIASAEVKDEITSSATKVVFTPPYTTKDSGKPKKGLVASELKDIAEVFNAVKSPKVE